MLSTIDYVILAVVLFVIILKMVSDAREIAAARAVKTAVNEIARKSFRPKLTILIQLESLEEMKETLLHLSEADFPKNAIVVSANKSAKETRALRYFISKNSMPWAKVITRKTFRPAEVGGKYAKSGLAVILPDTFRLSNSFYWDNVVAFGDSHVDAVDLSSSVRLDNTLTSGVEVLLTSWRRYVSLHRSRTVKKNDTEDLGIGIIIRAKYLRRMPGRSLRIVWTRRSAYSVSAQKSMRSSWSRLKVSTRFTDFITVLAMTTIGVLIFQRPSTLPLSLTVFGLLYILIVWWSLGIARISVVNRISVLLLSPLFLAVAWGLVVTRFTQLIRTR